ncbi:MAG: hypothetical protein LBC85_08430 [Fibromonadaceae bacterium]|jgi:hypothetical protein|nr:hypothetical protein [Fibromonadaceae bacterium]
MFLEYRISTPRLDFYDITPKVREAIDKAQMRVLGAKGRAYAGRFSWDSCFERQREFFAGLS